jgi:acetyl-CoA C-acetyltransferase
MFNKKTLTIEDVLKSRMITSPLHMFECNVLADGGAALVVTSADRAKEITDKAAYHIAEAEAYNQWTITQRPDILMRSTAHEVCTEALAKAGLTIDDMDVLEFYSAYPVLFAVMLEESGACEPQKGARFVFEGHTSPGGKKPACTTGDALSKGHNGSGVGLAYDVEVARQLMGKAGARQVPDCNHVMVTSGGGTGMNWIASIYGRGLP